MTNRERLRARVVAAATLCAALAPSHTAAAFDTVYNYRRIGTGSAVSIGSCGVTTSDVLGGGNNLVYSTSGLGHAGGDADNLIDSGETVRIASSVGARPGAAYRVSFATDSDEDGSFGESFVEAFSGANSLGVLPVSGVGWIEVAALFGGVSISSYRITSLEQIRIDNARWRLPPGVQITASVGITSFSPAYTVASPMVQCGVSVSTSDGNFHVDNGLGIVGGASDRVDAGESLLVTLGEPIHELAYQLIDSTNVGGTAAEGDHFIEAFGVGGESLGFRSASDDGSFIDLTALYGEPIESFELIGVNDSFRLRSVRIVPEPAAGLGTASLLVLLARAFARARSRRPRT